MPKATRTVFSKPLGSWELQNNHIYLPCHSGSGLTMTNEGNIGDASLTITGTDGTQWSTAGWYEPGADHYVDIPASAHRSLMTSDDVQGSGMLILAFVLNSTTLLANGTIFSTDRLQTTGGGLQVLTGSAPNIFGRYRPNGAGSTNTIGGTSVSAGSAQRIVFAMDYTNDSSGVAKKQVNGTVDDTSLDPYPVFTDDMTSPLRFFANQLGTPSEFLGGAGLGVQIRDILLMKVTFDAATALVLVRDWVEKGYTYDLRYMLAKEGF